MTAYAIAQLRRPGIVDPRMWTYLERIQATPAPFGGRFLVHGAAARVVEGSWPGAPVVLAFPDLASARAWWDSPACREILPLRTGHLVGEVILVEGVAPDHDSAAPAARLRAAAA